jgi:hypothetical protein
MSEKIYACLLRLYPAKFRRAHGEDALQLFRDRLRDETGFFSRLRLWLDLFVDLAASLLRPYIATEPALAAEPSVHATGVPLFFVLERASLSPAVVFYGFALTLVAVILTTALLNQVGTSPSLQLGGSQSQFPFAYIRRTPLATKPENPRLGTQHVLVQVPGSFVPSESFFPPPINYFALTNIGANPSAQLVVVYATSDVSSASRSFFVQAGTTHAAVPACVAAAPLDAERQSVLAAVIANLKQHYFDPAAAEQMADALVAGQRCGDDTPAADGKTFAALLTAQMRDVSHDMHLEVVYNPAPASQSTPNEFARMLAALQKDNCSFKKVQILPHNIGYVRLDAFLEPSACRSTAVAAMASLNNADALIFDLRNNRGGTAEMVSLISSYLFDHPEYMFDPRRIPTRQSWTSSPVDGSKLANKPVFILTSSMTISAAEQFTYDLKMLKRATVVGETTAGGAHAGVWHRIDDHYGIAIPENRPVNPYSHSDWEAVGIQPDIKVPSSAALQAALQQAQSQLDKKH